MLTVGLPGVSYGGVSRREGWSAPGRSEYQMARERRDGIAAAKGRSGNPVTHMRHWLLLPRAVNPAIWTREMVWDAAQQAETRKDAREARFFDISWPRELPTERIGLCHRGLCPSGCHGAGSTDRLGNLSSR